MKYGAILLTVSLMIFSNAARATGSTCRDVFQSASLKPTLEMVTGALAKLPESDATNFFEISWGGADQLNDGPGDTYGYRKYIRDSFKKPQPFYNKRNQRMGGIAVYKNAVFAEGYYRMTSATQSIQTLLTHQPWLRWTKDGFQTEHGNPANFLLADYVVDGKVRLFRGLSTEDLKLMSEAKVSGDLAPLFEKRDVIFFSPDESVMKMWSNKLPYIEIEVSVRDFQNLYAGIEYDYVELALLPEAIKNSISTMKIHQSFKRR